MPSLLQQLLLPQLALGGLESVFNALLARSSHTAPILRKLAGNVLEIQLTSPNVRFFLLFSENRIDWLGQYEGEADCAVSLNAEALPSLADKRQLSELINNKSLILNGDLQVLQHFSTLLDELEKDPAELLSPLLGDVAAQAAANFAQGIARHFRHHISRADEAMADNLMTERPVLAHRLQVADFCDQVQELEQQAVKLAEKMAKLGGK